MAKKRFKTIHVFDLENPQDLAALEDPQLALTQLGGYINEHVHGASIAAVVGKY